VYENKNYSIDFSADAAETGSGLVSRLDSLKEFIKKYLYSPLIYVFLIVVCLSLAFAFSFFGPLGGMIALSLIIGIPMVLYSMINLRFGIITIFSFSFFLQGINKFSGGLPLGIILDVFLVVMLVGLIITKWLARDFKLASNPISYVVWAWIIYNGFELFNPLGSVQAWIFVIRGIAVLMIFYFIMLQAMNGIQFCKNIINIWIALSLVGALYGLFQEFHGFFPFEKEWIHEDEFRFKLIFNWGRYRIFSFFNDPTVFGILMAYTGLLCITLLTGPFKLSYKIFLAVSAGIMLLAMVYAGTRTAFAMIPAGFLFYSLLTFQKRTLAFTAVIMILGSFVIFSDIRSLGPFLSTNSLTRIRSTFRPSEDPSFQVRERSQAYIKPYIQSHPFGGGLGSTGLWGQRFRPGSLLASFNPDSGYVRVAVELGWFGLFIYCLFFVVILIVGIKNYYRIRSPEIKAYLAAMLSVVFSIVVANYPQQALIQVPTILVFYAIMAMIIRLRELDESSTTNSKK
jgi:putative inorganic carbon (hco3(-)) transporter